MSVRGQMTGTGASMMNVMRNVCCTTFASDSVRVIMEPVPSWSKSYPPSSRDFSYTATRMSLPTRVVAAADGSLYFVNDSGYLFKIGSQGVGGTLPDQATGKGVNQKDQKGGNAGTAPGGGKSTGSGATGGGSV